MAKSARASSRKNNNQKLKRNVFGPVETARTERLSAKLLELVAQQKPEIKEDVNAMEVVEEAEAKAEEPKDEAAMDVDSVVKPGAGKRALAKKRIEKRHSKKGSIVFPKYKDRSSKRRK